jgi:hypothetical protein
MAHSKSNTHKRVVQFKYIFLSFNFIGRIGIIKRNTYLYILECIGYSMNTIVKRTITKEITQYSIKCDKCGKEIVGSSEGHVNFNAKLHREGKRCKNE